MESRAVRQVCPSICGSIVTDKIFPVALKAVAGISMLAFLLLGYEIVPSIIFGAIAGLAGGTVSAWWQTPGGAARPTHSLSPTLLTN
jgi:energy-converting hydrogenase Eha subunit A